MHSINGPRGETNLPLASQKSSLIKFAERIHGDIVQQLMPKSGMP